MKLYQYRSVQLSQIQLSLPVGILHPYTTHTLFVTDTDITSILHIGHFFSNKQASWKTHVHDLDTTMAEAGTCISHCIPQQLHDKSL